MVPRELSKYVRHHAALAKAGDTLIDIGLANLHAAVLDIPETLRISQATDIVESLTKHYQARVNDPIIEDKEEPQDDKPRLSFPAVRDAFIPQSFRVLRQTGKARRLEDEATWEDLARRNDLGAFLLSYLSSPYSTESPLLILGHPGSGKSLLTTVLSSQLMSKHFTVIRVPLREVNAEAGVVAQIEEAIRRITNINVDSWARLSGAFKNSPPLVVLDGYDELLQASGKVFSSYLKDVQHFQKSEVEQGRPVRVIVTSRVTLIDKATVPSGATILRLLEFDKNQRERWISIWNRANVNYFREANIEKFALLDENEIGAEKILSLAEQPLLLLMLALYDSEANDLRISTVLDRTKLYDSLLRRFVARERGKEKGFDDLNASDRKKALDVEMQRLGVAALGMYNRRKVHILATELNEDLKFFNAGPPPPVLSGRPLSQADLLLGSFFFVHRSKAQHSAGAPEQHEEISAFEFLHNTFGEFLTADFVLRRALTEAVQLKVLKQNEDLRENLEKHLNSADGLQRQWFASMVYTPLFTRPVVLEMMREWVGHILPERNLTRQGFISYLDTIILNQIKRLLTKREMPSIIRKETAQEGYRAPFGDHPLLGHIAIYSINLILLRIIVSDEPFVFDETQIGTHEDGARPWDRLTHIWRSWFAVDNLSAVTAIMVADRNESQITVRAKETFQVSESRSRLEAYLNVGISLGDNISSGLTGLLLFHPYRDNPLNLEDVAARLRSERIDLDFQIAMKRLFESEHRIASEGAANFIGLVRQALEMALHGDKHEELEHIVLSLRRGVRRLRQGDFRRMHVSVRFREFSKEFHPKMIAEVATRNPQAALVFLQVAKEMTGTEWNRRYTDAILEFGLGRYDPMELCERDPDAVLAWLQLARELGGGRLLERVGPKLFHSAFFERALDPRNLLELSERNPEAAVAWLQLARELGGGRVLERFGPKLFHPEFFERALDPRYLLELSERNPEAAVAWLQLARELGGGQFLKRYKAKLSDPNFLIRLAKKFGGGQFLERYEGKLFHPDFMEQVLDPRYLVELSERNPEAALAWLQLARELGGGRFLEGYEGKLFHPDFMERVLDPRYLLELSERNPESALAWLQLVRELGGGRFLEGYEGKLFHPDFMERVLDPRYLLELSERNPEATLLWLQFILEVGGQRFLEKHGREFFDQAFDRFVLTHPLRQKPSALAVALRLARAIESPPVTERIGQWLDSFFLVSAAGHSAFSALPLASLPDLHWLASRTGHKQLRNLCKSPRSDR